VSICNRPPGAGQTRYAAAVVTDILALLVEDDERLARFTAEFLAQHGVEATCVADGNAAVRAARSTSFDVVVLDLMLPGRDGLAVCRELRTWSAVPILIVTARTDEPDRIVGLELGADDYLGKPFSPRELLARVRALVRRARGHLPADADLLRVGRLELHAGSMSASFDGRPLELTTYEFTILRVLAERAGRVLSREQISELARGTGSDAMDRSVDVRISRIRQKLGEETSGPSIIKTVRGVGYMLVKDGEAA
jgi:two-component system OmpR family response regulator